MRVLRRCVTCFFPLVVDEGPSVRETGRNRRQYKDTGRETAECPRCGERYDRLVLTGERNRDMLMADAAPDG